MQGLEAARSQHDLFIGIRVLRNTAFGFEPARPVAPDVHNVGCIMPAQMRTKSLPRSISRFFAGGRRAAAAANNTSVGVYLRMGAMTYLDASFVKQLIHVSGVHTRRVAVQ